MSQKLSFLLFCAITLVTVGACSENEQAEDKSNIDPNLIRTDPNLVCFNHSLLVLDSATYSAAVNSEFIKRFAFSYEKKLIGYEGFYLIGKTNYLELFHPNSFEGSVEEPGTIWICLASLKANYLKQLNSDDRDFILYESDEAYNSLSLVAKDTFLTTREMKRKQYESWTKKKYHDSISFLSVDYNSPAESDSSSSYLMRNVYGIGLSLHPDDSLKLAIYLNEIGYNELTKSNGYTRISNNGQFIELRMSEDVESPSINRYYIQLNESVEKSTKVIGRSRIECDGKKAIWIF